MANKPIIAIDIDEVLAEFAKDFVVYSNERWGTNLSLDNYHQDWAKMWELDFASTQARSAEYFGDGRARQYEHVVGTQEALLKLKEHYDLIVVTARPSQTKDDTLPWIQERFPGIFNEDKIYFAGFWDKIDQHSIKLTKGKLAKELGAKYLIDDQLTHCLGADQEGVQALLFGEYSWNKSDDLPATVVRVKNWAEVLEYFNERAR
jgi:5'(3')-deoxyribonucleotidase